ncbi:DUF4062 domain-containing protein [Providencia vermicola]|uniref:DUF4062 domain-containing protein n=1 Tax=Providencia vermicola TaxID=333965 RepID=UPI0032D9BF47
MDKRYQVFVSSTYVDLKEERQKVIQTIMEMDCIPAGMELFPAADEEQWEFIKKIINDCDYYLLIIGGRYGSLADDGISYTEKEFDYAIEKGLKVIAIIHNDIENIPQKKSEKDPELALKLERFKSKVQSGRMVKFWKDISELAGAVSLSLNKTIKMYPAIGWVRANKIASSEILEEINELRKENNILKITLDNKSGEKSLKIEGIADLNETYTVHGGYYHPDDPEEYINNFKCNISWIDLFLSISPSILSTPNSNKIRNILANLLFNMTTQDTDGYLAFIYNNDFDTVMIQLKAYGLISIQATPEDYSLWQLTSKGESLMMKYRTIKKITA